MEKMDDINNETFQKILVQFIRTTKKFNEFENFPVELENGEKLYPSQLHILEAIGSSRANNVTELSEWFHITKGGISQVVNKLYDKDFIHKERNEDFGKEVLLSLTSKGEEAFNLLKGMHKLMEEEFITYLEGFSYEEIDSFILILGKIEEYIDAFLSDKPQ